MQQTKLINETLTRDTKEAQDIEMIGHKLGQIAHASEERSDRMTSKTVGQELRDIIRAEQELNSTDSSVSAKLHRNSVAEIVSATSPNVGRETLQNIDHVSPACFLLRSSRRKGARAPSTALIPSSHSLFG